MLYRRYKTMYGFAKFEIIQRFGDDIRIVIITLDMTNNKQQQSAKKLEHLSVIQDQEMSTWLKKIRASKILHWHLSMKEKWSSMLLKVGRFSVPQKTGRIRWQWENNNSIKSVIIVRFLIIRFVLWYTLHFIPLVANKNVWRKKIRNITLKTITTEIQKERINTETIDLKYQEQHEWDEGFELPDESIQDYFEYTIK